jgi:hypothetical protein
MSWLPNAPGLSAKEIHALVLLPEHMLEDLDKVARYLDESYDYVMSLPSK